MAQPSLANLERRVGQLADAGDAPSLHTLASYRRRWRQWQAFADHYSIRALPADPVYVAAFAVARYRAGVSASTVSANLSAVGWYHARLDPPVDDVVDLAKGALRGLRGDGSDKPLSPAPVLSVGALVAMATTSVVGVAKRSAKLIRQQSGIPPRQLAALGRGDVAIAEDGSFVELHIPAMPARGRSGRLEADAVRLEAGATILDCPVEAMRALLAEGHDQPFPPKLVDRGRVEDWDPFDEREGVPLRLAARNRAVVCVGYAGALRVEELSQARVEHLEALGDGYRLLLPVTKTSRDGASQAVVLEPTDDELNPVRALDGWLAVRGDEDGPLFHNVHHHTDLDRGLTTDEIRGVLQDLAAQVGLPSTVSGHSLRRSWATHTYLRDRDALGAISLHLRHSQIDTTVRYIEELSLHLVDPEDILSRGIVTAGPGGQSSPAKSLGFDDAPLDDLVAAALEASRNGASFAPSTLKGYASYWSRWERWATDNGFGVFPADPRAVALFAAARAEEGIAPNTLRSQLRAMEAVHTDNGVLTVGFVRLAAEIIAGLERTRRPPRRKAPIIPLPDLRAMATWALDHSEGSEESLRDHLMLTVGYAGGLRIDDLHRARLENLEPVPAGYVLWMSVSKLNQSGRRSEGVLLARRDDELDPVAAVDLWKERTGRSEGPLLPVLKTTGGPERPISKAAITDRFKRLAARSGASVLPTGHSLRRSWATHAYEAGLDLLSISRQLRHRRTSMTKGYVDSLTPWRDHPADTLHGDDSDGD